MATSVPVGCLSLTAQSDLIKTGGRVWKSGQALVSPIQTVREDRATRDEHAVVAGKAIRNPPRKCDQAKRKGSCWATPDLSDTTKRGQSSHGGVRWKSVKGLRRSSS